jgi:hypothetical protein
MDPIHPEAWQAWGYRLYFTQSQSGATGYLWISCGKLWINSPLWGKPTKMRREPDILDPSYWGRTGRRPRYAGTKIGPERPVLNPRSPLLFIHIPSSHCSREEPVDMTVVTAGSLTCRRKNTPGARFQHFHKPYYYD